MKGELPPPHCRGCGGELVVRELVLIESRLTRDPAGEVVIQRQTAWCADCIAAWNARMDPRRHGSVDRPA